MKIQKPISSYFVENFRKWCYETNGSIVWEIFQFAFFVKRIHKWFLSASDKSPHLKTQFNLYQNDFKRLIICRSMIGMGIYSYPAEFLFFINFTSGSSSDSKTSKGKKQFGIRCICRPSFISGYHKNKCSDHQFYSHDLIWNSSNLFIENPIYNKSQYMIENL